jgi:thymidylate synthase ThyX
MNNTQITATIIADSINSNNNRITTFELTYPRWIHAEVMTHRLFSRNAASSRAIPVSKTTEAIKNNPAIPVFWGANQAGMQSNTELKDFKLFLTKHIWNLSTYISANLSSLLAFMGLHKQYANRVSEYAQVYKIVVTATEFDNFFHLRCHKDAQPEIQLLATKMYGALQQSTPKLLHSGEWHLPYCITTTDLATGETVYTTKEYHHLTLEDAKKLSASCCAQVSYRLLDESLEKAILIYDRLVNSTPIHASPFEHQATPIPEITTGIWPDGVTHFDKDDNYWSGNFKGWIQHRHLIDNNTCNNYSNDN